MVKARVHLGVEKGYVLRTAYVVYVLAVRHVNCTAGHLTDFALCLLVCLFWYTGLLIYYM